MTTAKNEVLLGYNMKIVVGEGGGEGGEPLVGV